MNEKAKSQSVETTVQKGSEYVLQEMMRKYKLHSVLKDNREQSAPRVQPHDPHAFWSFSRSSGVTPLVVCISSHGMPASDPEHLSQRRSSHRFLCPRGVCPALPTPLWLQQGHKEHTACSEQDVNKKYLLFYMHTVLYVCLLTSVLLALAK